jgi:hypothetical protein
LPKYAVVAFKNTTDFQKAKEALAFVYEDLIVKPNQLGLLYSTL